MPRRIGYTKAAARALARLPGTTAASILTKLEQLAADPASLANNITALMGTDYHRLRVGDYRVIYSMETHLLTVIDVGHRGAIYR